MTPTTATIIGALIAALTTGGTVWVNRRTASRSATREETQQALDAQDKLLDRYEKRIEKLEDAVKTSDARAMMAEVHSQTCERRLALIEHMLVDMGGILPPRSP